MFSSAPKNCGSAGLRRMIRFDFESMISDIEDDGFVEVLATPRTTKKRVMTYSLVIASSSPRARKCRRMIYVGPLGTSMQ